MICPGDSAAAPIGASSSLAAGGALESARRHRARGRPVPRSPVKANAATNFSRVMSMAFSIPFVNADTFAVTDAASPAAIRSAARAVESTNAIGTAAEAVSAESPAPDSARRGRQATAGQPVPQTFSSPRQTAPDGPHRATELTRRLLVRRAPEVAQHHRRTVSLRQPADLLIQPREQLGSVRGGVRVRHRLDPPALAGRSPSGGDPGPDRDPAGSPRRATGPASHRPGPWRPCAPGPGRWPGRRRRRRAGRRGCGGRRPRPSGRAAGPGPRTPPRPRPHAGSRTAPAVARRSARRRSPTWKSVEAAADGAVPSDRHGCGPRSAFRSRCIR